MGCKAFTADARVDARRAARVSFCRRGDPRERAWDVSREILTASERVWVMPHNYLILNDNNSIKVECPLSFFPIVIPRLVRFAVAGGRGTARGRLRYGLLLRAQS